MSEVLDLTCELIRRRSLTPDDARSPPFEPTVRDGKLYGRGAADMKSGVAAMVVALEQFVAAHPNHPGTVALLLTSDEEGPINLDGVRRVAQHFRETGQRIDWCVVGEPSSKEKLGAGRTCRGALG
jgi:succinyl-diaminopimelate desuccinylase